jgi:hypothetical protein
MKLRHIFENPQSDQPRITEQDVQAALAPHFKLWKTDQRPVEIKIDSANRIRIRGEVISPADAAVGRVPIQLETVNGFGATGLTTLAGLPYHCLKYLSLSNFKGQDLTSAESVTLGNALTDEIGLFQLRECDNLTTLEGIDQFKCAVAGARFLLLIDYCPNLAFDPYDYLKYAKIHFENELPHRLQMVKSIALTDRREIEFTNIQDPRLSAIIGKWRNRGPAAMIPLARELIAAGYTHHVRPT